MRPITVVNLIPTWTWNDANPKGDGYDSLLELYVFELNAQLVRPIYIWAQHIVKPKDDGSNNLSYPHVLGLNTWLNTMMLGLITRQTHMYLGSTRG